MAIKLSETYGWVVEELHRRREVAELMRHLVDRCQQALPHPDWSCSTTFPMAICRS